MKKNLVLTGMMGVGKSTIGKDLSNKLNMQFKDIDAIIEKRLSISIADIFDKKGEEYFRNIEEKESLNYIKKNNLIIALGGGAFMNENIRNITNSLCVSIWLDLKAKNIFERIKMNKRRPLFNTKSTEEDVKKICDRRKKTYSLANYRVDCNSKTKNQIVKEIVEIYENI